MNMEYKDLLAICELNIHSANHLSFLCASSIQKLIKIRDVGTLLVNIYLLDDRLTLDM